MTQHFQHALSSFTAESKGIVRGLFRKPGYAIAAWVMLGLAVAANAAVFAIVYGFLLKPLPYAQPQRISVVRERLAKVGLNTPLVSVKTYLALKQNLGDITAAGLATNRYDQVVKIVGRPHLLTFRQATPSLFRTLGTRPLLGRFPAAAAGQPGGPPEALISYHLWQNAFGGNRRILGDPLKAGGRTYRIVGVMPRDFFIMGRSGDAWLPYVITPKRASETNINYWMFVRRRPGVSEHRFGLALRSQQARMLALMQPDHRVRLVKQGYVLDARLPRALALEGFMGQLPWLLQAAAGLLLLLALANTINLGVVRQRARQHDFALRRVLGSTSGGIVRLILIEHLPIALTVGATATLLAWIGISTLHAFGLPPSGSSFHVTLAAPVVAFTWILTTLVVLAVALGPALMGISKQAPAALGHGPTPTGGKRSRHLQRGLGVVQVALATALVISGGLLGLSLWRVLSQPVGFDQHHRILATIALPDNATNEMAAWQSLKPALMKIPGVKQAAVTGMAPYSGNFVMGNVNIIGTDHTIHSKMPVVGADFFRTMGMRLEAGRVFTNDEVNNQAPVAVINDTFARQFFGTAANAIGQNIKLGDHARIIGVTRDILWAPTPDQYDAPTVYLPFGKFSEGFSVVVQAKGATRPVMSSLEQTIKSALPGSVVFRMQTFPTVIRKAAVFRAAGAGIVGAFASLAVLLAALGVFAITAFIARARLGEYGIRAALGADPATLLKFGFSEATWLVAIGLPTGLIGAYLLGRVIAGALYQTSVFDTGLYLAGLMLILTVVLVAAWGPARRAARTPIRNLIGGGSQ